MFKAKIEKNQSSYPAPLAADFTCPSILASCKLREHTHKDTHNFFLLARKGIM